MASFNEIVRQAPKVDAFALNTVWTLRDMLEALQKTLLEVHDSLEDETVAAMQAAYGESLTVHTIFNILHDSDESCSAEVLCVDGVPTLMHKCIGDRNDYTDGLSMLDMALTRGILAVLVECRTKAVFARLAAEQAETSPLEQLWHRTQYLIPLGESAFFVSSPKWACGFQQAFNNHRAYVLNDEGNMVAVTGFKNWVNNRASWDSHKATHQAVVTTATGELTLDARNIVFTLVNDPAELAAVAAELSKPNYWRATRVQCTQHSDDAVVHIAQHYQGRTYYGYANIHFKVKATAETVQVRFQELQLGVFSGSLLALDEFREHMAASTSMELHEE